MEKEVQYKIYKNPGGPDIGTVDAKVLEVDGKYFKDLAGTGELLPYEDWRLDAQTRAEDLAKRLSVEEIAGLMMYSSHQMVPFVQEGPFGATYDGKPFPESGKEKWALTDQQKKFLEEDHVRHVLVMGQENAEIAAKWNNQMQYFVERQPWGIPINFSSDPRHGAGSVSAEFKSTAEDVSKWPEGMGVSATFDVDICRQMGEAISKEYRALGITTALSPQIDLATEPRWMRFEDTFGTHPDMVADMAKMYCDTLQTTEDSVDGWGVNSVCAMAKHWPGGGPCEGGRDAHYAFGKYAVYPGENFADHLKPFVNGAFQLDGPTRCASAIMPYYTVSWNIDQKDHKNVGNSYSHYLINDLLREKYGYDGVVCTDWGITGDPDPKLDSFGSRCFGVENLTVEERHFLAIENGVDQFGGNSDKEPIIKAYQIGCEKYGEQAMRARMEISAVRLLRSMFRCGLFENPYLDPQESMRIVGNKELCEAGYQAQLKSVVLLKNKNVLPIQEKKKVYIPNRKIKARKNFFRGMDPEKEVVTMPDDLLDGYYERTEKAADADFALIFIESPLSDGFSAEDEQAGGSGYVPVSLQYRPYRADTAREKSVAGGDFRDKSDNRSYRGKVGTAANESDLDLILDAKKTMGEKPVIVCMRMHNAAVMAEFEPYADAILIDFGVQKQAILDIVSGKAEPSGLLPIQFPANMETVEAHCEDKPFDMEPYVDEQGHAYDFAFGMNWNGVITDERIQKYRK